MGSTMIAPVMLAVHMLWIAFAMLSGRRGHQRKGRCLCVLDVILGVWGPQGAAGGRWGPLCLGMCACHKLVLPQLIVGVLHACGVLAMDGCLLCMLLFEATRTCAALPSFLQLVVHITLTALHSLSPTLSVSKPPLFLCHVLLPPLQYSPPKPIPAPCCSAACHALAA